MNVRINYGETVGYWVNVDCGEWEISLFRPGPGDAILRLNTAHGPLSMQHDREALIVCGSILAELYGVALTADDLRAAIEAGQSALANVKPEAA